MPDKDKVLQNIIEEANKWYEEQRSDNGAINTNVMNTGLIVSNMVKDGLPIEDDRLYSNGQSQVKGLSGATIAKILKNHGETRTFTREGGRTSRGTLKLADSFRNAINTTISTASHIDYSEASKSLESFFVNCVREDYFNKQRLSVELDSRKPVSTIIQEILYAAAERTDKPAGTVLQHLVGAKLQLRFPDINIGTDHANSADIQTDREGDFQIGTTAFHVTVAPMEKLILRCKENKMAGYRPVILTLESKVIAAKQLAEIANIDKDISIQSAETFIGTNIEEIATYDSNKIELSIAKLIREYNRRIKSIEVDKSLMINEPQWVASIMTRNGFS